jgi:hypothetical protein
MWEEESDASNNEWGSQAYFSWADGENKYWNILTYEVNFNKGTVAQELKSKAETCITVNINFNIILL